MKTILLAAAVLALGQPVVAPAGAQEMGEADFKARCARCHTIAKAIELTRGHDEAGERMRWLDSKLARHHARDAAQRARIIAFMESARKKPAR
jgi:cytochrome c2